MQYATYTPFGAYVKGGDFMEKFDKTEKVSVNMNIGTLSQIDLLVDSGYYSNRSDFINQAVRQVLDTKQSTINQIAERNSKDGSEWFIGICSGVSEDALIRAKATGKKLKICGYGLLHISHELDDMVIENVEEIRVKGKIICSDRIKEHFGLK